MVQQVRRKIIVGIRRTRFDLLEGQQCIRDLLMCLQNNHLSWPDISSHFLVKTKYSSVCCSCDVKVEHESEQLYLELSVPANNSNLNDHIEETYNTASLFGRVCDGCKQFTQAEVRNQISLASGTKFILILLSRAMNSVEGFFLNDNKVVATDDLFIRYFQFT